MEVDAATQAAADTVESTISALDDVEAVEYLEKLEQKWHVNNPPSSYEDAFAIGCENFGVNVLEGVDFESAGSFGFVEIDVAIHAAEMEGIGLYHQLRRLGLLANDKDVAMRIECVLKCIFYGKRSVLSCFNNKLAMHSRSLGATPLDEEVDARLGSWALRFRWIDETLSDFQKLLMYLLDVAMEHSYRKQGDYIFEPIIVDGYNTHAWRQVCDISTFVYKEAGQKELELDMWRAFTSGSNGKQVIEYMTKCDDFQFRQLRKSRDVFSFKNGVYLAGEDRFYEFATATQPLPDSIVAAKYFPLTFNEYAGMRWQDIPTDHLQGILDFQGFSPEVSKWLHILIGRLIYPLNEHDGWQVVPFMKGAASSGKSTIVLKVCKQLYDAIDVGVLSNNIEKKFGLSAFYEKFIYVAPEIKGDLAIEQAEFQSIVSGEDIQIAVKHRTAFSTAWTVPGVLAGNEVPGWIDNSGSIQRRIVVFNFERSVVGGGDMKLGEKLEAIMPAIIAKCNRAYREAVEECGMQNIWNVLPAYFRATRDEMAQSTNSVEAFIASDDITVGADLFCPFDDFKAALAVWERMNNYKSVKFTADLFRGPFSKFKITKMKDLREYRGQRVRREYLVGVDLVRRDTGNMLG